MGKKGILLFLLLLSVKVIYPSQILFQGFRNYLQTDIEYSGNQEMIKKLPFEERIIKSASRPHLNFTADIREYKGVFDLSDAEIEYQNFTFDADINLARNIETGITLIQNLYSGEKILDSKRLHEKKSELLKIEMSAISLKAFGEYIQALTEVVNAGKIVELREWEYELALQKLHTAEVTFGKGSRKYELLTLEASSAANQTKLASDRFTLLKEMLLLRTGLKVLPEIDISPVAPENSDNDSLEISMLRNQIESMDIKKRFNRDDFKPTIDVFFTYGLRDNDLWIFEDGYMVGMLFKWNIWDGALYKNRNLVLEEETRTLESHLKRKEKEKRITRERTLKILQTLIKELDLRERILTLTRTEAEEARIQHQNGSLSKVKVIEKEMEKIKSMISLSDLKNRYVSQLCTYLALCGYSGTMEEFFNE